MYSTNKAHLILFSPTPVAHGQVDLHPPEDLVGCLTHSSARYNQDTPGSIKCPVCRTETWNLSVMSQPKDNKKCSYVNDVQG